MREAQELQVSQLWCQHCPERSACTNSFELARVAEVRDSDDIRNRICRRFANAPNDDWVANLIPLAQQFTLVHPSLDGFLICRSRLAMDDETR